MPSCSFFCSFFFFNDTATTEIYTLSLHDALPISLVTSRAAGMRCDMKTCAAQPTSSRTVSARTVRCGTRTDRKSTRLNSSHDQISYAVFCLKKKKKNKESENR